MQRDAMHYHLVLYTRIHAERSLVSLPAPTTVYKSLIMLHGQLVRRHIVARACDCLSLVSSEKTVRCRLHQNLQRSVEFEHEKG